MKGGIIGLHNKSCTFLPVQISTVTLSALFALARAGPRWRDDDEVLGCFRQTAARGAETVSTAKKTNKFMNWMTWHSESLQLRHSNKKKYNNTTQWILLLLWREIWMKTGRAAEKQKQRLHKRDQTAVFSSSDEHTATGETDYLCVIQLGIIHVRCDLSKEKALSISSLTFSSCHGAKTPSAVKPERNAAAQLIAQLSLSLSLSIASALYLSPTVYLPVLLQQWLLCFALHPSTLLPIPPTISLTPLPSLPPVTAPQQSNAAPSASIALISRSHTSQVWRQDETEFGNFVVFMIKVSCTCRFFPLAGFPANYKSTKAVSGIISAGWMSNHCEEQQTKLNDFSKFLHAVQNTSLGLVKHHGLAENTCFGRHTHGWKHSFLYVVTVKILVQNEVKLLIFLKT